MKGRSPLDGEPLRPAGSDGTGGRCGADVRPAEDRLRPLGVSGPYRRAQFEAADAKAVASTWSERARGRPGQTKAAGRSFEQARSPPAPVRPPSSRLANDEATGAIPDPAAPLPPVVFAAERTDGKLAAVESRRLYKATRRERRLVQGRAGREPARAGSADRAGDRPERPLLRGRGRSGSWRVAGPRAPSTRARRPNLSPALRARAAGRRARLADHRHPWIEGRRRPHRCERGVAGCW